MATRKPDLTPEYTVDDIHKVREWNYERRKDMTSKEASDDISRSAALAQAEIDALRDKWSATN